jgi:hypothetical protein
MAQDRGWTNPSRFRLKEAINRHGRVAASVEALSSLHFAVPQPV